jgi:hypothetical protein
MLKVKQAQSILEYAILIAIVIAAVVVMQVYMKRGISGRLKDSTDRISGGESFSASNTTTYQHSLTGQRNIVELTATDDNSSKIAGVIGYAGDKTEIANITGSGAYSAGTTSSASTTSNSFSRTDSAANESFNAATLQSKGVVTGDYDFGGTQK